MQNNQAIPFNKENFKQILSKQFAWVIVVSVPGALIAEYFNVPLAWFLGPMLVTSVVTLGGINTKMPKLVLSTIFIPLGLIMTPIWLGVSPELTSIYMLMFFGVTLVLLGFSWITNTKRY